MGNVKWWKKSFWKGLNLEENVFSFLSREKFNTWIGYIHIFAFLGFSSALLIYITRSKTIGALKENSIIAIGLSHHLFLFIFSFLSGICFLSIWRYDINKYSNRGLSKDPTYAFLVIAMILWMTMSAFRVLNLGSDNNDFTLFNFLVKLLSLLNSIAFVFTIQNLNIDKRSNKLLKNLQSLLSSNTIIIFFSALLLFTIVFFVKNSGRTLIGLPDFFGSIVTTLLFIIFIPKVFKDRQLSGILARITLVVFFSLTIIYQIIDLLHNPQNDVNGKSLLNFYFSQFQIDEIHFAYGELVIGIFYRFMLILVFFALITSSLLKNLETISAEDLINSIFEANENLRHDNGTKNELWVKLREYMGFEEKKHEDFVTLFSDPALYPKKEFQYTAPPFELARDMSEGGGSSEFPLFGVLFVLSSVYFKKSFDFENDSIDFFKKKFVKETLGLNDDQWYTLIEVLKEEKLAREKKDSETGEIFLCLNGLISGLFLHRTAKTSLFKKFDWNKEKSTLALYFEMSEEDSQKILNKMDVLRREGPKNFGKHNVSTSLLKLNDLLNPPVFKTQLFPNQENVPIPFRFYYRSQKEVGYFILEFCSQS